MGYLQVLNLMVKAYKAARGVMPKGIDLLKLQQKARQKVIDSKKVIQFPKERITNPFKPRPTQTESMICLLYTSPSPRDRQKSRMPSSA